MFDCYCDLLCYWMLLSLAMTQFHDPGLMFKRVQAKCPTLPRLAMNKSVPRTRAMMAVEPSGQSCSMRKSSSNSLQSSTSNLGICAFAASLVIVVPKVTDKGSLFETAKHPLPPLSLSLYRHLTHFHHWYSCIILSLCFAVDSACSDVNPWWYLHLYSTCKLCWWPPKWVISAWPFQVWNYTL